MGITPLSFTGVSQFSNDFQTILNRTVAIASVPLQVMQNEQADLLSKKQSLTDLRSTVADLGSAVRTLGETGENRALSVSSSNTSRVTATLNGATTAGTYTITDITSVAKAASETTASGYADETAAAVSPDGTMELVVGGQTYTVDLTGTYGNNLTGVRDAINALGAGVSASIVNTGTGATPYYLSITADLTGASTLELRETAGQSGTNILTATNQGSDAVFKLNGLTVTKSQNTITDVINGVSFTINSATLAGETVDLTLSSSRGDLATALSSLVSAYNGVRGQVNLQVGESAGLLSGDYIVREVQNQMRQLATYQGSGSISDLANLGIEFDETGVMSFDSSKFYSLPESDFSAALDFMGSPATGFGGLAAGLDAITDPITGLIQTQQDQYDAADQRLSDQIDALSERINFMQQSVSANLQQADVLLAQLESQQTMLEASLRSLSTATFGKKNE